MNQSLTRIVVWLERGTQALAAPLARRNGWLLVGFSVFFFTSTALIAAEKLLWFDELFTYHLSRLDVKALWAALSAGVDLNPPLNYVLTRGAHALLGAHPVTTRLPSILGFWVLLLCLYQFVAHRCGRLWGWLALLIPLATWAYPYAYEARPYGVVMGCCGVALLCWQRAADSQWWRWGLALALAAAVATHYYAVLLYLPLLLGEGVRTLDRRRIDGPLLLALAAGLLPLCFFLPLLRAGASYAATHTELAHWSSVHDFYYELLGRALLPLVSLLVVACLCSHTARSANDRPSERSSGLPGHEIALMIGLLGLPFVGILVAKLGGGAFGLRYVVSAVAGVALLGAALAQRLAAGSRLFGAVAVAVLGGWFLTIVAGDYRRVQAENAALQADYRFLSEHGPRQTPIVIPGPITYLQLTHYAPADLATRLRYVKHPSLETRYQAERRYSIEGALLTLSQWTQLSTAGEPTWAVPDCGYYVYCPGRLTEQLEPLATRLELRGRNGRNLLFFSGRQDQPEIVHTMPRLIGEPAAGSTDF